MPLPTPHTQRAAPGRYLAACSLWSSSRAVKLMGSAGSRRGTRQFAAVDRQGVRRHLLDVEVDAGYRDQGDRALLGPRPSWGVTKEDFEVGASGAPEQWRQCRSRCAQALPRTSPDASRSGDSFGPSLRPIHPAYPIPRGRARLRTTVSPSTACRPRRFSGPGSPYLHS